MLLELQHVIKRFHDKELLHIPVWQIHQGQRIGLIGANGCGKTTLLRILQGVCVVEEGVVRRFCTLSYFEQLSQQVSYGDGRLLRELSVSHLQSKKQVSGGEQQRLRLSKALSTPCHLYLLDEPTSNLDPRNQHEALRTVRRVAKERNISVCVILHDLNLAIRYCDRFLFLKDAEVYACGGIEVMTPENIEAVYRMHVHIMSYMGIPHIIPFPDIRL